MDGFVPYGPFLPFTYLPKAIGPYGPDRETVAAPRRLKFKKIYDIILKKAPVREPLQYLMGLIFIKNFIIIIMGENFFL